MTHDSGSPPRRTWRLWTAGLATAVLPAVVMVTVVSSCLTTTPFPDGPRFRSATLSFHENGNIAKGKLAEPGMWRGLSCEGWMHFFENGDLRSCQVTESHRTDRDLVLPEGSTLWWDESGKLESAWLADDTVLDGIPVKGGDKIVVSFHPAGTLRTLFLSRDHVIHEIPCKASLLKPVKLFPNGSLQSATLSRNCSIGPRSYTEGKTLTFDPSGDVAAMD